MKKIDLGQTIAILANIGVIAGIAFLALEIRQNTDAVRSTVVQDISSQQIDVRKMMIENPELRAAVREGARGEPDENQLQLIDEFFAVLMNVRQNRYLQIELGVIDSRTADELGIGSREGGMFSRPQFSDWWSQNRSSYSEGFRQYVEANLLPADGQRE